MQNTNNVANQKYQYHDDDVDYKEISIIKDRLKFMISIFKNTIKIFTKCIYLIVLLIALMILMNFLWNGSVIRIMTIDNDNSVVMLFNGIKYWFQ
jgi:uncharacterized membrane protein SpoIIM required for sporulation